MTSHSLSLSPLSLFLFICILSSGCSQIIQRADGTTIDVVVWKCANETLKSIVIDALTLYDTPDEINNYVQKEVTKADDSNYWVVYTQKYIRATADLLPPDADPMSLCFIQVENANLVSVVAKVAPTLQW